MPAPSLTPDQIAQVSGLVGQYITAQRERYNPHAVPLSAQQRAAMNGFFSKQLLDNTRLVVLQGERVANPDFYPMLRNLGFNNLPDQSIMERLPFQTWWSRTRRSAKGFCFMNSCMWNSIGNSAFRAFLNFTCADS